MLDKLREKAGGAGRAVLRAAAILLMSASAAMAGKAETKDSNGNRPAPREGSEVEVSWNPSVSVTVGAGETIEGLLARLVAEIEAASAGAYAASLDTSALQIQILRSNGEEIDALSLRENDPSIQQTRLMVNRPARVARIHVPEENPSAGVVIITLNNRVVNVTTTGLPNKAALAQSMLRSIRNAGFEASLEGAFLIVSRDLTQQTGLTVVGLRSTDPALITSEISLEAQPLAGVPALGARGALLLCVLITAAACALLVRRGASAPL